MSGFQPVQMPDFGATLARSQQFGMNQLIGLSQLRQMQQQQRYEDALADPTVMSGMMSADPAASANALTVLAQRGGPLGFQAAMPLIKQQREDAQIAAALQGMTGGGGMPPIAAPGGGGRPAAMPAAPDGGAPPLAPPGAIAPQSSGVPGPLTPEPRVPPPAPGTVLPGGMPQAANVPSFEGLWRIAQGGARGMEIAAKLAPLVAQMNPNLTTVQQGGQQWLMNPRTGTRVAMGPVDAVAPDSITVAGQTIRGERVNGQFKPYPGQEPPPGWVINPDGTMTRRTGGPAESEDRNRDFTNTRQLREEFNSSQAAKDLAIARPNVDTIRRAINTNTRAADLDMVFAFAKLLDPNSVVREGEQITLSKTGGMFDTVQGWINSLAGGQRLTPDVRQNIAVQAEDRWRSYAEAHDERLSYFHKIAEDNGFRPSHIGRFAVDRSPTTPQPQAGNRNNASLPRPATAAEAARLPPGTRFLGPDGVERIRP